MRVLSDRAMVAVVVAIGVGAWLARPAPVSLVAVGVAALAALAARRPVLLLLTAGVLASGLGARSWAGLAAAPTSGTAEGIATLVTDPVDVRGGTRAEVRLEGRRYEAWASPKAAAALRARSAGERAVVSGRRSPLTGLRRQYLLRRHVGARLRLDSLAPLDGGSPPARAGNAVRRLLLRGVASFPQGQQAMFAGIVLGDDRRQPTTIVEEFRDAGLAHLLAVSGQNVAFVLALATPLLAFLGLRSRVVVALAVLALFGVLTRWEPSVLRAEAMAAVTLVAAAAGRPISAVRVLAVAVAALLLVDPLLVGSVGFLLSVGACAGIALVTPRLVRRRVPLPVAVTLAAQVGVAPVLLPIFGGLPVVSTPANLLAGPVAGPLMMWGMGAGLVAGMVGGAVAAVLHLPTRLMLGWVEGVAHHAAALGLGSFEAAHVAALLALAVIGARARRRLPKVVAAGGALAVCLAAAVPACTFGPCASPSASGASTSPPAPWSWASSTARPTPSTTRAPTSIWTASWPERNGSWPRAPTSSTSVGSRRAPAPK
ncbi:MAG TPA: ComEC/Rec2 family competence protein [Acidimicrobiales bacterium]|nr:ComEC/Rec2 family competence protein [Acidimicrobiales bacterium]